MTKNAFIVEEGKNGLRLLQEEELEATTKRTVSSSRENAAVCGSRIVKVSAQPQQKRRKGFKKFLLLKLNFLT
jgi:hypothetical protein